MKNYESWEIFHLIIQAAMYLAMSCLFLYITHNHIFFIFGVDVLVFGGIIIGGILRGSIPPVILIASRFVVAIIFFIIGLPLIIMGLVSGWREKQNEKQA